MSTRAVIIVEGLNYAQVYKHHDGYPESTLAWLEKFNQAFSHERGDDPEYKLAQLLRSSVRDAEEFNLDTSMCTGWGITGYGDDNGQEFTYLLRTNGTVLHAEGAGTPSP